MVEGGVELSGSAPAGAHRQGALPILEGAGGRRSMGQSAVSGLFIWGSGMLCAGGPGNLSRSDLSLKDMSRFLHWGNWFGVPLGSSLMFL